MTAATGFADLDHHRYLPPRRATAQQQRSSGFDVKISETAVSVPRRSGLIGDRALDCKCVVRGVSFANGSDLQIGWIISPSLKRLHARIHVDDHAFGWIAV